MSKFRQTLCKGVAAAMVKLILNVCKLNAGLHRFKQCSNGKCKNYDNRETPEHFFMEGNNPLVKNIKEKCEHLSVEFYIEIILVIYEIIRVIFDSIDRKI
jgi:hypothetical protein